MASADVPVQRIFGFGGGFDLFLDGVFWNKGRRRARTPNGNVSKDRPWGWVQRNPILYP